MPTFQGSTIQRAIEAGLKQLGLPRDAVSVQVVQEIRMASLDSCASQRLLT